MRLASLETMSCMRRTSVQQHTARYWSNIRQAMTIIMTFGERACSSISPKVSLLGQGRYDLTQSRSSYHWQECATHSNGEAQLIARSPPCPLSLWQDASPTSTPHRNPTAAQRAQPSKSHVTKKRHLPPKAPSCHAPPYVTAVVPSTIEIARTPSHPLSSVTFKQLGHCLVKVNFLGDGPPDRSRTF